MGRPKLTLKNSKTVTLPVYAFLWIMMLLAGVGRSTAWLTDRVDLDYDDFDLAPVDLALTPAPAPAPEFLSGSYGFSWVKVPDELYIEQHEGLVQQMFAARDEGAEISIVFFGDRQCAACSVLQCMNEIPACSGAVEVVDQRFGTYGMYNLAMEGESTSSLMWRLLNGAAPVDMNSGNVTVVMLMVGSEDIVRDDEQDPMKVGEHAMDVADQLEELVEQLLGSDEAVQVVFVSLLPIASGGGYNYRDGLHFGSTVIVNSQMRQLANQQERVHFADCTDRFIDPKNDKNVNPRLLPDGMNPSNKGFKVLANCVKPTLELLLEDPASRAAVVAGRR